MSKMSPLRKLRKFNPEEADKIDAQKAWNDYVAPAWEEFQDAIAEEYGWLIHPVLAYKPNGTFPDMGGRPMTEAEKEKYKALKEAKNKNAQDNPEPTPEVPKVLEGNEATPPSA